MTLAIAHPRDGDREAAAIGAPGLVLGGKYRLEEAIARGGMARVWRARHITLNRPVAVKFVEGAGEGQERIDRFLREAKVAASVRHKNVVDILDFGVFDGDEAGGAAEPYMVMELLEGETLANLIERGPVDVTNIVAIALQLLSGLDAVHRAGIVHRDLKPGNVFLTHDHDGTFARLLDFGISQGAEEAGASTPLIVGTPEYMSPEQAMGAPLDARADLYSIGVILYEMLSGRVPFEHEDGQQVLEMVVASTPIPVVKLRPDAPELCAVVDTAMARAPEARFETARDMRRAILEACGFAEATERTSVARDLRPSGTRRREDVVTMPELAPAALEAAASEVPSDPAFVPPRPRERRWMGAVALLVVALVIALGVIVMRSAPSEPPAEPSASLSERPDEAREVAPPGPVAVPPLPSAALEEAATDDANEAATDDANEAATDEAATDATAAVASDETAEGPRSRRRRRSAASEPAAEAIEPAPAEAAPPRAVVTDLDF